MYRKCVVIFILHFSFIIAGMLFETLDNGLQVVIKENRTADIVSVKLYVKTGSMFEQEYGGAGISHYFEHILCGGSTYKRTEEEYRKWEKRIGAYVNAYTSKDHTCYYITCPAKYYKDALEMLSEWTIYCKFDSTEIEREKGVILKEILLREKRPTSKMYRIFLEELFSIHPLRYPIIGYEELLKKITRKDILEYYKKHYTPQNMILVVVGNINKDSVFTEVKKLFGRFERKNFVTPSLPLEPKRKITKRKIIKLKLKIPRVLIGFITVPLNHDDMYPLDIVAEYINLPTSVFQEELKEKEKLVNYVYAYHTSFLNTGYFIITAEIKNTVNIKKVERKIFSLLKETKKRINQRIIKTIVKNELTRQRLEIQSIPSEASYIGNSMVDYGVPDYLPIYCENLKKISQKEINEVIKRYLDINNAVIVYFVPEDYTVEEEKLSKMEKSPEKFIPLENGVRIIYERNPAFPTFTLAIGIEGGVKNETKEINGITQLALMTLTKGTRKYSKKEIKKILEQTGARLYTSLNEDRSLIIMEGLKEDFNKLTELIKEIILYPTFPEKEIEQSKEELLANLKRSYEHPEEITYKIFLKKFFKNHPYALYPKGDTSSVVSLNAEAVRKFYVNKILVPQNIVVALYGDIEEKKAIKRLKEIFGKIEKKHIQEVSYEFTFFPDTIVEYYNFPQVNIYIVYPLENIIGENYYPFKVIQQLFVSSAGRLYKALREKRDLVYYGFGYINMFNKIPLFFIETQTSVDKYKEVLLVIKKEIERLKKEELSQEELEETINEILLNLPMQMDTNRKKALRRVERELDGFGYDFDDHLEKYLKKLTPEDIRKAAERYLNTPFVIITMPHRER